jgi:putative transposase
VPTRRRRLIHHQIQDKKPHLSSRRICRLLGLSRPHINEVSVWCSDKQLVKRITTLANRHKRYGWRRVWVLLQREGYCVSKKRFRHLWRLLGLQVRKKARRRRKTKGLTSLIPTKATHPNHVWTLDFVHDTLSRGRKIRLLTVLDEFTRECLAIRVERSLKSTEVIETLKLLFHDYGTPYYLRSDNGSEFIARAVQGWLAEHGTKPLFIEPGSPWQNGKCESFNGKLRDECLNMHLCDSLREAQTVIHDWREEYNGYRPHSSLNYQTPRMFAQCWFATQTNTPLRSVV